MSPIDIVLERETANDESAVVVMIHVAAGTEVQKGEPIFDIENSKATQEVVAPETGILSHSLEIGQTVGFGVPIAHILSQPGPARPAGKQPSQAAPISVAAEPPPPPPPGPIASPPPGFSPRFSRAALALMETGGLAANAFEMDFVTANDVRARLDGAAPGARPAAPRPSVAPPKPAAPPPRLAAGRDVVPVSRSKAAEIASLSAGAGQTMLSVLGTTVGPLPIDRTAGGFLDGTVTDLVIYEASRLMRRYSRLNAFYADGGICTHDAVHAGFAIDSGGRLVVCGLENTDRMDLIAIQEAMADAVARYLDNRLSGSELTRATFTVTDLSATGLDFVLPLLPQGQSCIIGITHQAETGFRLFVGFDHRVTEGREAGLFLAELSARLQSHRANRLAPTAQLCCAECGRSMSEAAGRGREKGLLKIVDRYGQDSLCCMSCWNGW